MESMQCKLESGRLTREPGRSVKINRTSQRIKKSTLSQLVSEDNVDRANPKGLKIEVTRQDQTSVQHGLQRPRG